MHDLRSILSPEFRTYFSRPGHPWAAPPALGKAIDIMAKKARKKATKKKATKKKAAKKVAKKGAKKKGGKKKSVDLIISKARTKAAAGLNVSSDFYVALDEMVRASIATAEGRASANNRKTLRPQDL